VRISGDMRPQPEEQRTEKKKEVVVTVPDWEPEEKTVFGRLMNAVGLGSNGE